MISERALSRENSGNAVSYRVAACRKRMRTARATCRPQVHLPTEGQLRESQVCPPSPRSEEHLINPDLIQQLNGSRIELRDEIALLILAREEQEADIT